MNAKRFFSKNWNAVVILKMLCMCDSPDSCCWSRWKSLPKSSRTWCLGMWASYSDRDIFSKNSLNFFLTISTLLQLVPCFGDKRTLQHQWNRMINACERRKVECGQEVHVGARQEELGLGNRKNGLRLNNCIVFMMRWKYVKYDGCIYPSLFWFYTLKAYKWYGHQCWRLPCFFSGKHCRFRFSHVGDATTSTAHSKKMRHTFMSLFVASIARQRFRASCGKLLTFSLHWGRFTREDAFARSRTIAVIPQPKNMEVVGGTIVAHFCSSLDFGSQIWKFEVMI